LRRADEVTVMSMNIAAHTAFHRPWGRRRGGRAAAAGGRSLPETSRWDDRVAVVDALAEAPGFPTGKATSAAIVRDPGSYYVNVFAAHYPMGAVRGQL
jgi:hypothetical protein